MDTPWMTASGMVGSVVGVSATVDLSWIKTQRQSAEYGTLSMSWDF
jgi:hypothetical protein